MFWFFASLIASYLASFSSIMPLLALDNYSMVYLSCEFDGDE